MLSKCANPSCSAPFQCLHEGKMFQLDMEVMRGPEVRHQGRKLVSKQKWSRKIEHYWLCNACASSQTLVFKKGDGITVVPLERAGENPDLVLPEDSSQTLTGKLPPVQLKENVKKCSGTASAAKHLRARLQVLSANTLRLQRNMETLHSTFQQIEQRRTRRVPNAELPGSL